MICKHRNSIVAYLFLVKYEISNRDSAPEKKTVIKPEETLEWAISKNIKIKQTYESRCCLEPTVDKFILFQKLTEYSQQQASNSLQQLYNSRHSYLFRLYEVAIRTVLQLFYVSWNGLPPIVCECFMMLRQNTVSCTLCIVIRSDRLEAKVREEFPSFDTVISTRSLPTSE